jgi:alpha-tubulin suppressor-like RCC1 family protein
LGTGNTSNQPQPALVPSLKGMSALLAGADHSLAFPQEGGLLVFGHNDFGQLGLNHTTHLPTPTLCPVQPGLPHSFTSRSTKKSARFL